MTTKVTIEMEVDEYLEFTDVAVPSEGGPPASEPAAGVGTFDLDRMVILDPDVKAVFQNSHQVNAALRAILNAIPKPLVAVPAEAA